ncbi:hypothetical protein CP02DC24_1111, partial [Chlamydia psittaci 02DC24]
MFSNLT